MKRQQTKKMQRYATGGMGNIYGPLPYPDTYEIPNHLKEEYRTHYQITLSHQEYRDLVKSEIEAARLELDCINLKYKLWFGKYKGENIHQITDDWYLNFLCEKYRNTNPSLVGQALFRLDELRDNPLEN